MSATDALTSTIWTEIGDERPQSIEKLRGALASLLAKWALRHCANPEVEIVQIAAVATRHRRATKGGESGFQVTLCP